MNVMVTGGSGFLGRHVLRECLDRDMNVISLSHSEKRLSEVQRMFPSVPFYTTDISNGNISIENLVEKYQVDYIVHTAAMKYIGVCETNPTRTVEVNIDGSRNLINIAKKHGVKNIVAVSTDKAINPTSVYGSSKLIMEKMMLEYDFSVLQGVNFFYSTGSVLDIWFEAMNKNKPISINVNDTVRYFVDASEVAKKLVDSFDVHGEYISLDTCYRMKLHDLAKAFCKFHNYDKTSDYHPISAEKNEEEIPENVLIKDADIDMIQHLLKEYYEKETR